MVNSHVYEVMRLYSEWSMVNDYNYDYVYFYDFMKFIYCLQNYASWFFDGELFLLIKKFIPDARIKTQVAYLYFAA